MVWLTLFGWLWKCLFTCNHLRTPVNEGKCFCPDCGRGLVYRWITLRCGECRLRRDSRYLLRRVVPTQRCCPYCGEAAILTDVLESPDYFQLHKAWLIAQEAQDFQPHWRLQAWTGPSQNILDGLREAWQQTRLLLEPAAPPPEALALLPVRITH